MSTQKDEKWLDEMITRTINTTRPEFDSEKWKQKYHKEFQTLVSRADKASTVPFRLPSVLKSPITKLAAAALIILAIGFFMIHLGTGEKVITPDVTTVSKSPAEMLTVMSLNIAYRRGGMEAVERQCEQAIEKLGPRPAEITIKQILTEFNGI